MVRFARVFGFVVLLETGLLAAVPVLLDEGTVADSRPQASGLLVRELIRQSVLIACNDLGLVAFDQLFLDEGDAPTMSRQLAVDVQATPSQLTFELKGTDERVLLKTQLTLALDSAAGVALLARELESSRNSFRDVLTKEFEVTAGTARRSGTAAKIDTSIGDALTRMDLISQLMAARSVQRDIDRRGTSILHLAALVRAYANLSLLTRHHWNATSLAMAARALVYAERLASDSTDDRFASIHRAYALCLVGLHAPALTEFERVDGLDRTDASSTGPQVPGWMLAAKAFAECDLDALTSIGNQESVRELCQVLKFHTIHDREDWTKLPTVAVAAADECPAAFGIYFQTYRVAPLGPQRWSAAAFANALVTDLPKIIQQYEGLLAGIEVDREPISGVLKRLMKEEFFLAAYLAVSDARNAVKSPQDEMVNKLSVAIKGHPFEAYVRAMGIDEEQDYERSQREMATLIVRTPVPMMTSFLASIWRLNTATQQGVGAAATARLGHEYTAHSVVLLLRLKESVRLDLASVLASVSPKSPVALREKVWLTKNPSTEQMKQWEGEIGDDANALLALGRAYLYGGDKETGIRLTRQSLDLEPNVSGYSRLAQAHWVHGDYEKFQATLEECVEKTPDDGLGHAAIQKRLAEGLMEIGKWKEAEQPAVAAASTYAAWAMEVPAVCYEGLEKWDESEYWVRELSHAYGGKSRFRWYFWCKRNGRGDLRAAKAVAEEFARTQLGQTETNAADTATYFYLEGDKRRALELFRKANTLSGRGDAWVALMTAMTAGELREVDERDLVLTQLAKDVEAWKGQGLYVAEEPRPEFVERLTACLTNTPTTADLKELEDLFARLWFAHRQRHGYFLGRLFADAGDTESAEKYWKIAIDGPFRSQLGAILAGHALTER